MYAANSCPESCSVEAAEFASTYLELFQNVLSLLLQTFYAAFAKARPRTDAADRDETQGLHHNRD